MNFISPRYSCIIDVDGITHHFNKDGIKIEQCVYGQGVTTDKLSAWVILMPLFCYDLIKLPKFEYKDNHYNITKSDNDNVTIRERI